MLFLLLMTSSAWGQKDPWVEVQSPNFLVVSDAGEKHARRVAEQFEQFRATFQTALPKAQVNLGKPLIIFAAKNEKSLRALLPEYWEQKGRVHPQGLFMPGEEKLYVALRTDVVGEMPYQVVYHEYIHALVDLNFESIPVWLNEGFAEYYANTVLGNKKVGLGRPDRNSVFLLREEKLLPLEVLFAVDHKSPHYNERNKASIFYAQSWALIHYLMVEDLKVEKKRLVTYMDLLFDRADPVEAARRAFGDLKELEKTLTRYVQRDTFQFFEMKAPADVDEATFPARALPPAESTALRGDFLARRNRPVEARALLDEAMRLDPANALAHEAMGFLHLRQNDMDGAAKWFDKASELDTKSYIALYFSAMMALRGGGHGSVAFDTMEAKLLRALEINPRFAPAHSTLANVYLSGGEKLEKAYIHAKRASELEPGEVHHRFNVVSVLLRLEKVDDAIAEATTALRAARTDSERNAAQTLLDNARQFKEILAHNERARQQMPSQGAVPESVPVGARPRLQRRSAPPRQLTPEEIAALEPRQLKLTGKKSTASGAAATVACERVSLDLTLERAAGKLRLHSANYFKLTFMAYPGWEPPQNFQPCEMLKNMKLKVTYDVADDPDFAGEITAIEILKP